MRFDNLDDWLRWQETLHPNAIDLGLERLAEVAGRMGLGRPAPVVITVGGTNGKGSTVAFLEAILRAAGYRVGCYTSPHLLRYQERIRIDGEEASAAHLCAAFERIDAARGGISLTYFEFGTLAAFDLFARAGLDAAVLEVGMGGRLDAVNLIDADLAVITTVDLDHMQWLGEEREAIGREKAGILRPGRPAVCVDPDPPASLLAVAAERGVPLLRFGVDFDYSPEGATWRWQGRGAVYDRLPLPALRGSIQLRNASGVVMALEALAHRLPVSRAAVAEGLLGARLAGRLQLFPGALTTLLDVAHNPQSTTQLAAHLRELGGGGRLHAVVGMLADKAIEEALAPLLPLVARWYAATLAPPRGADAARLGAALTRLGAGDAVAGLYEDVPAALAAARREALAGERLLVFGSFHTVAAALPVVTGGARV